MGTRAWGLESSVENQSPLRPCPPVSGGQGRSDARRGQLKKNHQKFLSSFQKSQVPVIYIVAVKKPPFAKIP